MTEVLWNAFWFIAGLNVGVVGWGVLRELRVQQEATTPWERTIFPDVETRLYHGQVESRRREPVDR